MTVSLPKNFALNTAAANAIGRASGASAALALTELATTAARPLLVLANDARHADQLEAELGFFASGSLDILHFVEWETLPWDNFSPHQDIISQRLSVLAKLATLKRGIVVATAQALLQRLPPTNYIAARSLNLNAGQTLLRDPFLETLTGGGYYRVPQVNEHGEFAVRGSLIDIFPMGSDKPLRIDFLDDEIESLRFFATDTQLSGAAIESIELLPAREVPLDAADIREFRSRYRERFEGQPGKSRVYRDVSDGIAHGGIEYFLPLFFDSTACLLDHLPGNCIVAEPAELDSLLQIAWQEIAERHELASLDPERPVLNPDETFFAPDSLPLDRYDRLAYSAKTLADDNRALNLATRMPPAVRIEARYEDPASAVQAFIDEFQGRILFTTESPGRREQVFEMLSGRGLDIARMDGWRAFLERGERIGVALGGIAAGVVFTDAALAIISEQQLFGERTRARKRRAERDPETIIRQLSDLQPGSPVVHAEHGVGRYLGLITLDAGGIEGEFLHLEYADGDKLYVPVHALQLISRYTGASAENAPLHRLGSGQWEKARRKAAQKARDVAAELLDVYARRAARPGHAFNWSEADYLAFQSGFPFELTEDQATTIDSVLADLRSDQPMDRVVCGDVGFGKTEVALRAAFAAVHGGKQVAILVPTTLLAQQHGENFRDRFADWPVRVEVLSRFQSPKQAKDIIAGMQSGSVDIVIGTHRLLQHTKDFEDVGLVIIDEEHRFGVRHKETIKSLRSEIDVLTLTATPIPRTLNMTLGGLREMSLITTPPAERLAVKTFVTEWNDVIVREACLREIKRGGQIYFIHNRVEDIQRIEQRLAKLVPEASIRIGHGQMPERELEQVMFDFYHRRFNVLLCTTIVESGIDVPTANTIIINRADRFGLAQLHQLRGRVGRSHHRAFAYLLAPPRATMTADAIKRLEAIDSLEDLGAGFTLATHDLEIRGAGELLGDEQSGQIQEIGFSLYMDMLSRAVDSLRKGNEPDLDAPLDAGIDINLHIPAMLPADYVPDVHVRLILYKRLAAVQSPEELREFQVELIDRFGLLPEAARNLVQIAELRHQAAALGAEKIDAGDRGGFIDFVAEPAIDAAELVRLVQQSSDVFKLQGAERLRFSTDLSDIQQRFAWLKELLLRLQN